MNSIDYVAKNIYLGDQKRNLAVQMESKDIRKALQLYQEAVNFYNHVIQSKTAKPLQIELATKMYSICSQRANTLIQYLSGNQPQQPIPTDSNGKTISSTNISTPIPSNISHTQQLTAGDKSKSSNQIISPVNPNNKQNLYSTQQLQNTPQLKTHPKNSQSSTQRIDDQISNKYQEGLKFLTDGKMMDEDGFYDLAKSFYDQSIKLLGQFFNAAGQINQNNVQFWIYQIEQRKTALDFYNTTSVDSSSYYFNKAFKIFDQTKTVENLTDEEAIEIISLLKKCQISSQDQFLSNLAKNFEENLLSHRKSDNFNIIKKIIPKKCDVFVSQKVKSEMANIASDHSKKFVLIYGPSGSKITKLIRSTAFTASVKAIYELNLLNFIGINDNPVSILNAAIENAKKEAPSYLILNNIDACLKEKDKNDNFSIMICDYLIHQVSAGINGITIFCVTNMPWMTPRDILQICNAKLYYPAPDELVIKNILKNNIITHNIDDNQLKLITDELIGYTDIAIDRILIEAQITNAMESSGGHRNDFYVDISQHLVLRNGISNKDIIKVKSYIQPIVAQSGLMYFDQIKETIK